MRPDVMVNVVEDAVVVVARGQTTSHVRPGAPSEPRYLFGHRERVCRTPRHVLELHPQLVMHRTSDNSPAVKVERWR